MMEIGYRIRKRRQGDGPATARGHVSVIARDYNARLFETPVRRRLHLARFFWLERRLAVLPEPPRRVLELGCFDCRSLDCFRVPPERYVGVDANWEGGLDRARQRFSGDPRVRLVEATRAADVDLTGEAFDLFISFETLQYLHPPELQAWFDLLGRHLRGTLLVVVPNYVGPVFLGRFVGKRLPGSRWRDCTPAEVLAITVGATGRVKNPPDAPIPRVFDWRDLLRRMRERFDVIRVDPLPFGGLPLSLSFQIGIVARTRGG